MCVKVGKLFDVMGKSERGKQVSDTLFRGKNDRTDLSEREK